MKKYQGNIEKKIARTRIYLTCISNEATELLTVIKNFCPYNLRESEPMESFICWLYHSHLIKTDLTLEEVKILEKEYYAKLITLKLEKYYSFYNFTYWLIRYSKAIKPSFTNNFTKFIVICLCAIQNLKYKHLLFNGSKT